jgi:hypothetical protein
MAAPLLVVAAACAGGETPTTPTTLPTNTPGATDTVKPTASATAVVVESPSPTQNIDGGGATGSPTVEPIATPTVAPTPSATAVESPTPGSTELEVTFSSFIADLQAGGTALDKYKPIKVADLTTAYNAFAADPDIKASGIGSENPNAFKNCMNLKSDPVTRPSDCGSETVFALEAVRKFPGNAAAQNFANDMARYDVKSGTFSNPGNMKNLIQLLQDYA